MQVLYDSVMQYFYPWGMYWKPGWFSLPQKSKNIMRHSITNDFICNKMPPNIFRWLTSSVINLCWQDTSRRFISSTCMQASTPSSTGCMGCIPAILCLTCAPITAWRRTWTLLRRWSRWAVSHTVACPGGFPNTWDLMKFHSIHNDFP